MQFVLFIHGIQESLFEWLKKKDTYFRLFPALITKKATAARMRNGSHAPKW